jgi:hypothetical protein
MLTFAMLGAGLLLSSSCESLQTGGDGLSFVLSPEKAQVCRDAVQEALAEKNVTEDWIDRIRYKAHRRGRHATGFQAWVYPKAGGGVLVVELSQVCRVTRIWARGLR